MVGLAHDDRVRVRCHAKPIARLLLTTEQDLESTILVDLEVRGVEVAPLFGVPGRRDAGRLSREVDVLNRPANPTNSILMFAADRRVLIVVVGIVCADLRGFMDGAMEHGRERVGEFNEGLERSTCEATQISKSFSTIERALRRSFGKDRLTRPLERVTKILPGFSRHQAISW